MENMAVIRSTVSHGAASGESTRHCANAPAAGLSGAVQNCCRTGRTCGKGPPPPCPRAAASEPQFDSLMSRPLTDWIGRAFIGYRRAKMPIWSFEIGIGVFITIHSTPSLQGGVVSEPM